jgi:hypothetical protein
MRLVLPFFSSLFHQVAKELEQEEKPKTSSLPHLLSLIEAPPAVCIDSPKTQAIRPFTSRKDLFRNTMAQIPNHKAFSLPDHGSDHPKIHRRKEAPKKSTSGKESTSLKSKSDSHKEKGKSRSKPAAPASQPKLGSTRLHVRGVSPRPTKPRPTALISPATAQIPSLKYKPRDSASTQPRIPISKIFSPYPTPVFGVPLDTLVTREEPMHYFWRACVHRLLSNEALTEVGMFFHKDEEG